MFNHLWNPHYDFSDANNLREIAIVDRYKLTEDTVEYNVGQQVESPWGSNRVIDVRHVNGEDICIKEITVKPGFMLSLQRHRGRAEIWEVKEGILTVISDGAVHEILAGQSITLPKGAVHCMINTHDMPVTVIETQTGICREKDNIRLLDFNARPIYPLTGEMEYRSARLYARIQQGLVIKFGHGALPDASLLLE